MTSACRLTSLCRTVRLIASATIFPSQAMTVPNGYSPLPTAMRDSSMQRTIIASSVIWREESDAPMFLPVSLSKRRLDQLVSDVVIGWDTIGSYAPAIVSVVSRDRDYSLHAFLVGYRWITIATGLLENRAGGMRYARSWMCKGSAYCTLETALPIRCGSRARSPAAVQARDYFFLISRGGE